MPTEITEILGVLTPLGLLAYIMINSGRFIGSRVWTLLEKVVDKWLSGADKRTELAEAQLMLGGRLLDLMEKGVCPIQVTLTIPPIASPNGVKVDS